MWCRYTRRMLAAAPSSTDIHAAFKVLGVTYSPHAPAETLSEQVRKSYRELARLHHPDLSSGDDNRMKLVNTAYELIQSSGVLQGVRLDGADPHTDRQTASESAGGEGQGTASRFRRKAGSRRHRMPDDFASGDDAGSGVGSSGMWSMKSSLDWQALMNATETLTKEELSNPANHPFSHSRFFSFDEDVTIYKMIRGGATVPQVARTLGKPATFIEKRLHNAQFKLRVQYVLRGEKRSQGKPGTGTTSAAAGGAQQRSKRHGGDQPHGPTAAAPTRPLAHQRLFPQSPYEAADREAAVIDATVAAQRAFAAAAAAQPPPYLGRKMQSSKKREWEATMPRWQQPRYFEDLSLEEKGKRAGLLRRDRFDEDAVWGPASVEAPFPNRRASERTASKMGRSYSNYARLRGEGTGRKPKRGR